MPRHFVNPLHAVTERRFGRRSVYASNAADIIKAVTMGRTPPPEADDWIGSHTLAEQLGARIRTFEYWQALVRAEATKAEEAAAAA
jgi:hypothetical protein